MVTLAAVAMFAACSTASDGPLATDVPDVQDVPDAVTDLAPPDTPQDDGIAPGDLAMDPAPVDLPPEDRVETVDADACQPRCQGKACGDDGCGGTCGTCAEGAECITDRCIDLACDVLPDVSGPAAVLAALSTPAEAAKVAATCHDFTGDGKGDSAMKGMSAQINGPMADAVSAGTWSGLLQVRDFASGGSIAQPALAGYYGRPCPECGAPGAVRADPASIGGDCIPWFLLGPVTTEGTRFHAGPGTISMPVHISGLPVLLTLVDAEVTATVESSDSGSPILHDGVFSGVLTMQTLEQIIGDLQSGCTAAAEPKPDVCAFLKISGQEPPFDLHAEDDGTWSAKTKDKRGDAMSVCLAFDTTAATIAGWVP